MGSVLGGPVDLPPLPAANQWGGNENVKVEPVPKKEMLRRLAAFHEWIDNGLGLRRMMERPDLPEGVNDDYHRHFEAKVHPELRTGLFTDVGLEEGDIYLRLPWEMVMTVERALESPLIGEALKALEAKFGRRDEATELCLFLISEKSRGHESRWAPYLDTLPRPEDFFEFPFYWNDEDLAELQGTMFFMDLLELRMNIADAWARVYRNVVAPNPTVFPPEIFHPIAFRWAYQVWQSRCIQVMPGAPAPAAEHGVAERPARVAREPVQDVNLACVPDGLLSDERDMMTPEELEQAEHDDQLVPRPTQCPCWAFVPGVDFTNCRYMQSSRSSRTLYEPTSHMVTMRATESYAAGAELFENYGWTNHAYLLAHGFILSEYPSDRLHVPPLRLPFNDEARAFLLFAVLGEWDGTDSRYPLVLGKKVDPVVHAIVFIVNMTDDAVQAIMRALVDEVTDVQTTKAAAARRMLLELEAPFLMHTWMQLAHIVDDAVRSWPEGSIGGDEQLLKEDDDARAGTPPPPPPTEVPEAAGDTRLLRPHQRHAIEFRLSQRRLAESLIEHYEEQSHVYQAQCEQEPELQKPKKKLSLDPSMMRGQFFSVDDAIFGEGDGEGDGEGEEAAEQDTMELQFEHAVCSPREQPAEEGKAAADRPVPYQNGGYNGGPDPGTPKGDPGPRAAHTPISAAA